MTTKTYVNSGRPTNPFSNATAILKYFPAVRTPWHPHRFERHNVMEDDFQQRFWLRGRGYKGPGHPNSGYYTGGKTYSMWDTQVSMVPKHELEKFMPDIHIGPKALVTPVSVMNARAGHRVTHDLLHSYDRFVGRYSPGSDPVVDHDNITPQDPNHVGLHADTIGCRARIFRWLRRGPFFNEDHYFRRSVQRRGNERVDAVQEHPLYARIIALAKKGKLKAACEAYRKAAFVPPVEVYRALTAACARKAKLADAVAIYEEGSAKLLYTARDFHVIRNVMRTAIAADHPPRVMWIYNSARGTYHDNVVVRAPLEKHEMFALSLLALEYLLDAGRATEARTIFRYVADDGLLHHDLHEEIGLAMRKALEEGKTVGVNDGQLEETAGQRNARALASDVGLALYHELRSDQRHFAHDDAPGLEWLQRAVGEEVDVLFVLRRARYENGRDLLQADRARLIARACHWLKQLSQQYTSQMLRDALPYLKKSKPTAINPNLRIAADAATQQRKRLTPTVDGFAFFFKDSSTRFVAETFPQRGETLRSQFLALQPNYTDVAGAVGQHNGVLEDCEDTSPTLLLQAPRSPAVLHPSVTARSAQWNSVPSSSSDAGAPASASGATSEADAPAARSHESSLHDVKRTEGPSDEHFS